MDSSKAVKRIVKMSAYGKPRARQIGKGRAVHKPAYTAWLSEFRIRFGHLPDEFHSEPVKVGLIIFRPIPKRTSKANRVSMLGSTCTAKPDADNAVGTVMDALFPEKTAPWDNINKGDKHVVSISTEKRWGNDALLYVSVELVSDIRTPDDIEGYVNATV